jgi:hypothetical protein
MPDDVFVDAYRMAAYMYACGRLDAIELCAEGSGIVISDFVKRVMGSRERTYFSVLSIQDSWERYAAELQQLVTVDLGVV